MAQADGARLLEALSDSHSWQAWIGASAFAAMNAKWRIWPMQQSAKTCEVHANETCEIVVTHH
jgi:hypothetical protein